jgi:hypothetical protein
MPTYDLLNSNTLSSTSALITWSSIPSTYTDLVIAVNIKSTFGSSNSSEYRAKFNGDAGNNYASATLRATNAPAINGATKGGGEGWATLNWSGDADGNWGAGGYIQIFQYANTNKYKTYLAHTGNSYGVQGNGTLSGLWYSNSAINQIEIFPQRDSFAIGSTFNLYGIKAA